MVELRAFIPQEVRMRFGGLVALLPAVLLLVSCSSSPTRATPVPTASASGAASVSLDAVPPLIGDGHVPVTATVRTAGGVVLVGVRVAFTTDFGTLSADAADTDAIGVASTSLAADGGIANLTARVDSLLVRRIVIVPAKNTHSTDLSIAASVRPSTSGSPAEVDVVVDHFVNGYVLHADFADGELFDGTALTFFHTFRRAGDYSVEVVITDGAGRVARAQALAHVVNAPPPPPPPPPPLPPTPGLTLTLGCVPVTPPGATSCNVAATDETGTVVTSQVTNVAWDWGDGTTTATASVLGSRLYAQPGSYLVIAVATGPGGRTGRATKTITIP
jgi:hypothetical protein